MFPASRPRRLRTRDAVRRAFRETLLTPSSLVAPIFVCAGIGVRRPIDAIPGYAVLSVDLAVDEVRRLSAAGVGGVLFFGVAATKDATGSEAWDERAAVPAALRALRDEVPGIVRWADVCLCAYTSHGHCGVIDSAAGVVDNDATLPLLSRVARTYAAAGAEIIAPSDMMDGRVAAIRGALEQSGHSSVALCAYAAKFASALYGPFREAAQSHPTGDRRSYQLDPANADEAVREAVLDVGEGADVVMVKPASGYLDIVSRVARQVPVPVAAYQVSGEYAMVKAAGARGWIDERAAALESLIGIRRAGARIIVSYFAGEAAGWLS